MSDPEGPTTQRILFADELAWIEQEGLSSFQEQGPDLTLRFSFRQKSEAEAFGRWLAGRGELGV